MASRLRVRITLQSPSDLPDEGGGVIRGWEDVDTVWAEILPISGGEMLRQLQLQSVVTHRVTIRYRDGVSTAMRVAMGARTFAIRAVINPSERNEVLELLAEENGE